MGCCGPVTVLSASCCFLRNTRNREAATLESVIEAGDSPLPLALAATVMLNSTVVVASITDLRSRLIPDRLTAPAAAGGLALAAASGGIAGLILAAGAGLAVALPLYLAARIKPRGMGMGDVKLVAVIGIFLGLAAWGALLAGLAVAALTGILISLGRRESPALTTLPLAPFLAVGTAPFIVTSLLPIVQGG